MPLLALDVAVLLPPEVRQRAVDISASLPSDPSHDLRLDDDHLPHITLTQQFVRVEELDPALERVDEVLRGQRPLMARVTGGAKGGGSVWMAIERTQELTDLHERLMEVLGGFERPGGTPGAFVDEDARGADVMWVTGYRLKSSFGAFAPHITLGHADDPPQIEPFAFEATTVAACHLGRFCSCRQVLRSWMLTSPVGGGAGGVVSRTSAMCAGSASPVTRTSRPTNGRSCSSALTSWYTSSGPS